MLVLSGGYVSKQNVIKIFLGGDDVGDLCDVVVEHDHEAVEVQWCNGGDWSRMRLGEKR